MNQISTISEFLLHAGTDYRVFDMGRGIRRISNQQFIDIENTLKTPQFPRLNHMWFGVIFWNKQLSNQHYIWFVKLPLDEQGLLISATRNHFLQIIVDALGEQLEHTEKNNGQLPENPYTFIPTQQQLADFNSISRCLLKLGHSPHYQVASEYLSNPDSQLWQSIPQQGLSDAVASLSEQNIEKTLISNFDDYPSPVKYSLLVSLENQTVTIKLAEKITLWLSNSNQPVDWQYGLRALSQSPCTGLIKQLLIEFLNSQLANDSNNLMVISGRLWHHLEDTTLFNLYIEQVAKVDAESPIFSAIYADLVQIPVLRQQMLNMIRNQHKSDALTSAVGKLFSGQ